MKTMGLDIGTTTVSAAVRDDRAGILTTRTLENNSFLPGKNWERLQDPAVILDISLSLVTQLLQAHPDIAAIGISTQMHGILYLDQNGVPCSPLYTWQDGRGDLPHDDSRSWAAYLSETTGYALATGYGLVTHCYNLHHGLVPEEAAVLCTIGDYLAMVLAGRREPVMDPSNAASLGLYDAVNRRFDSAALEKAGIDPAMLPKPAIHPCLGCGPLGIPVCTAIGDNQASFLGATSGRTDALLVNMGTGGQISLYTSEAIHIPALELRPFPEGGWLLVGASLCGGRSYALLEQFFRETVKLVTGQEIMAYDAMARAMETVIPAAEPLTAVTLFQGTRQNPQLRGSIQNIGTRNFTPQHLISAVMRGMAQELHQMYRDYLALGGTVPCAIIGSGNGLRKNPHLCRIFSETFGLKLTLSQNEEEAAWGAAIYAAKHGKQKTSGDP